MTVYRVNFEYSAEDDLLLLFYPWLEIDVDFM